MRLTLALLLVATSPLAAQMDSTFPARKPDTTYAKPGPVRTKDGKDTLAAHSFARAWGDTLEFRFGDSRSSVFIWDHVALDSVILDGPLPVKHDTLRTTDSLYCGTPPCPPGQWTKTPPPPPTPTLTAISISPKTATVQAGKVQGFAATLTWSDGQPHGSASWSATGGQVTTSGGFTAGSAVGSFVVVASSSGKADTAKVTVISPPPPPPPADTNHVGPQVRTAAQWSAAIAGSYGKAGDTVWVRTGAYAGGNLAASNRVFRCWPGERCTSRPMVTTGAGITVWGMECTDPALGSQCIDAHAPGTRLINNVVHDAGHSGIGLWWYTQGGEAYGNIVYNNGKDDNLDHGIYFNNTTGTMRLRDNVVFDNWAYGIHGYSSTPGELTGLSLDGNVAFGGHGIGAFNSTDIMIGGAAISSISVTNQFTYKPDGYISAVIGRPDGPSNGTATVSGYFVGDSALQTAKWASVNRSNVTAIRYASRPSSGTQVYVRPNAYEKGRGHVIVYNWGKAALVSVDLSSVLTVGRSFEVHNVCDLWGTPLASSGSYDGKPVTLSMATFAAPKPIGRTWKRPAPDCGGQFSTFLATSR